MDAKLLMVDDWVEHAISGEPMKVKCVFDDGIEVSGGQFDNDYINPINITEERLSKNGFIASENSRVNLCMVKHGNDFVIEVYIFEHNCVINVWHNYFIGDEYVMDKVHKCGFYIHEIQQTLRLCGLNDIVKDFKI